MLPAIINNESVTNHTENKELVSSSKPFILANTVACTLQELRDEHIIPVFIKDNEPVISQVEFIQTMQEAVQEIFSQEMILQPSIRLSHPIKGRIPEARHKKAIELLEHEKTIYYERMAFAIEIPTIFSEIDGNTLSLTLGGIKAYNLDNLYNRKGADEHFKVFIGFKNTVCTNLCVWSDGYAGDVKVKSQLQLKTVIKELVEKYDADSQLYRMRELQKVLMNEQQFATLIGKCRMYQYLPKEMKTGVFPLSLTDNHIAMVTRDFYQDKDFHCYLDGSISLWKLYNLFTGANKSSYIDNFLDRSVNAYQFVERLRYALQGITHEWYLE